MRLRGKRCAMSSAMIGKASIKNNRTVKLLFNILPDDSFPVNQLIILLIAGTLSENTLQNQSRFLRWNPLAIAKRSFTLDLAEESMGNTKTYSAYAPIMDVFQNGKTFVCDEIESHLHPLIVRQLVGRLLMEK